MKTIVAVLASTFLVCVAYAEPAASPSGASANASSTAMAKADLKRDMKVEQQIKDLHAKLKISPAEESQWAIVAKTMRESAKDLDAAIDKRELSHNSATAIDDLNAYGEVAQAHADAVKKLASAFAPLYASMADDQKKTADDVFAHRGHGKK
jgi:protein CpxP